MRKLKFRIWDKLTESFIYCEDDNQQHFILDLNGNFHNLQNGSGGDECVVQQYTGLKDKNGVEIYEGDILSNAIGELFTIYFDKGCFFIHPIWKESDEFDIALYFCKNIPSVIGNIYENKELLK